MALTISPELEARVRQRAERQGTPAEAFAEDLIITALDLQDYDLAEEVAAIEEGLKACEEGRERPFGAFIAEHRTKYGPPTR